MSLPPEFSFTQGNLSDFAECRRRFYLRYVRRLLWPAPLTEPVLAAEERSRLGAAFHHLAQQSFIGLPAAGLEALAAQEDELAAWWRNFSAWRTRLPGLGETPFESIRFYPEITLSIPLAAHRLIAKYDLLAALPDGRFVIYDWKTTTRRPRRTSLEKNFQTRIYPFVLARAGRHYNGGAEISPGNLEMIYWYPAFPDSALRFPYSAQKHIKIAAELETLAAEIDSLSENQFVLTSDIARCRLCNYRSLCERGDRAGSLSESEEPDNPQDLPPLNLAEVAEIEF